MGSTSTSNAPTKTVERLAPDLNIVSLSNEKTAAYWVGVIPFQDGKSPHPPAHSIDLAGVTFPETYTPWRGGDDPAMQRGHYYGSIVELSESQVATLKDALKRSIVRWRSREGRHAYGQPITFESDATLEAARKRYGLNEAQVAAFKAKAAMFRITKTDEPLAKYLYCVKVPGGAAVPGGTYRPSAEIPASILETGIEAP